MQQHICSLYMWHQRNIKITYQICKAHFTVLSLSSFLQQIHYNIDAEYYSMLVN